MKIYVISLREAKSRRKFVRAQLDSLGLEYEFFDAVNGAELSDDFDKDQIVCKRNWHRYNYNEISAGELGCSLSHRAIMKKIAAGTDKEAIILEDDAGIDEKLIKFLKHLPDLKLQWDIINLSWCKRELVPLANIYENIQIGCPKYTVTRTMAYIIRKEACNIFLKNYPKITRPIDIEFQSWWEHDLKVLATKPEVVRDSDYAKQSQIDKMGRNLFKARGLKRILFNQRRLKRLEATILKRLKFNRYIRSITQSYT